MYKNNRNFEIVRMSVEETNIEESSSSLSEVSSLDDDFDRMHFESASSDDEITDDEVNSHSWDELGSESDAEFLKDHELVEEVTPAS